MEKLERLDIRKRTVEFQVASASVKPSVLSSDSNGKHTSESQINDALLPSPFFTLPSIATKNQGSVSFNATPFHSTRLENENNANTKVLPTDFSSSCKRRASFGAIIQPDAALTAAVLNNIDSTSGFTCSSLNTLLQLNDDDMKSSSGNIHNARASYRKKASHTSLSYSISNLNALIANNSNGDTLGVSTSVDSLQADRDSDLQLSSTSIFYGSTISLLATLHGHYLSYENMNNIKASSMKSLMYTRFVLSQSLDSRDYGVIKYGDEVYIKAGREHIIGTSLLQFSSTYNSKRRIYEGCSVHPELIKLTGISKHRLIDITHFGRWKVLNKHKPRESYGDIVFNKDEILLEQDGYFLSSLNDYDPCSCETLDTTNTKNTYKCKRPQTDPAMTWKVLLLENPGVTTLKGIQSKHQALVFQKAKAQLDNSPAHHYNNNNNNNNSNSYMNSNINENSSGQICTNTYSNSNSYGINDKNISNSSNKSISCSSSSKNSSTESHFTNMLLSQMPSSASFYNISSKNLYSSYDSNNNRSASASSSKSSSFSSSKSQLQLLQPYNESSKKRFDIKNNIDNFIAYTTNRPSTAPSGSSNTHATTTTNNTALRRGISFVSTVSDSYNNSNTTTSSSSSKNIFNNTGMQRDVSFHQSNTLPLSLEGDERGVTKNSNGGVGNLLNASRRSSGGSEWGGISPDGGNYPLKGSRQRNGITSSVMSKREKNAALMKSMLLLKRNIAAKRIQRVYRLYWLRQMHVEGWLSRLDRRIHDRLLSEAATLQQQVLHSFLTQQQQAQNLSYTNSIHFLKASARRSSTASIAAATLMDTIKSMNSNCGHTVINKNNNNNCSTSLNDNDDANNNNDDTKHAIIPTTPGTDAVVSMNNMTTARGSTSQHPTIEKDNRNLQSLIHSLTATDLESCFTSLNITKTVSSSRRSIESDKKSCEVVKGIREYAVKYVDTLLSQTVFGMSSATAIVAANMIAIATSSSSSSSSFPSDLLPDNYTTVSNNNGDSSHLIGASHAFLSNPHPSIHPETSDLPVAGDKRDDENHDEYENDGFNYDEERVFIDTDNILNKNNNNIDESEQRKHRHLKHRQAKLKRRIAKAGQSSTLNCVKLLQLLSHHDYGHNDDKTNSHSHLFNDIILVKNNDTKMKTMKKKKNSSDSK